MENKAGRMAEISRILADGGVNIRALSVADTTGFGLLRLIVDDPEKAERVCSAAGPVSYTHLGRTTRSP